MAVISSTKWKDSLLNGRKHLQTIYLKGVNIQNIQLNNNKPNNLIKQAEHLNRYFYKEDKPIANRSMKRCSASLITREMQIKVRYHFLSMRMGIIEKKTTNASEDEEKRELLCTFFGKANWCSHYGKQYEIHQKIKNRTICLARKLIGFFGVMSWKNMNYLFGQPNIIRSNSSGSDGLLTQSCPTLVTPWTVARQAPLSMGFSRQEHWSGLPFATFLPLGIYLKKIKTLIQKDMYPHVHSSIIYNSQDMETT